MSGNDEKATLAKSKFDRLMGSLTDLNETVRSAETVTRDTPLFGVGEGTTTYITQTIRQKDVGDFIFVEVVSEEGTVRLVLPPKVSSVIARQRDSLASKNRSRSAKASAQERMARGEVPGFARGRRGSGK